MEQKKAIIIGASSGIGRELAKILSRENYIIGISARRKPLLDSLAEELSGRCIIKQIDVTDSAAGRRLNEMINDLGGVDLAIYCSGTGHINPELQFNLEKNTIEVNVTGFTLCAGILYNYFEKQGHGHFAAISSLGALIGNAEAPAYDASKAYMSNYMQGIRLKALKSKKPIIITDIKPGFVDTEMAKGEGIFWMAPAEKAALQIYNVLRKKKTHAYITKRWRLIAWIFKILPERILAKTT